MKRLALLAAGGALWLFLAVTPVFADGGPHVMANNNGTGTVGLAGDCAACHRAHTAQATDLLVEEVPDLCLRCHDGTGATVDVVDGVQYVPDTDGTPTTTVLGALRGGGYSYALIGDPARLSYAGRGSITLDFGGAPASGAITLTWPAFTGFAGGSLSFDASDSAATVQALATTLFGTSAVYSTSTDPGNMSGLPANNNNVIVTKSGTTGAFSFALHNAFRLGSGTDHSIPLPTVTVNSTGGAATIVDGVAISGAGHVGVLTSGAATTSNHMAGNGVVWGNGVQGSGTAGAAGVVLDCASCHNPHGNGQYRILQTDPGENLAGTFEVTNANGVAIADVANATNVVRNYTVLPGDFASDVVTAGYAADDGDYWRYKYDPSGAANFTNFYLRSDPMNSGWNGNSAVAPTNTTGAMTAWCVQCHTRYNGYGVNSDGSPNYNSSGYSPSSLVAQTPTDDVFMYKHGTTRIGCEQCHVSHGSNVTMVAGTASADVAWPGGGFAPGTGNADSRLLKVNNRGTCQLCHDPTGTLLAGTEVGTIPGSITPGP